MRRRAGSAGRRERRPFPWPLVGGILLWVVLAVTLPGLDPEPRGEWLSRRGRGTFARPWCPPCGLVEDHVTDNAWVSGIVGVGQLIVLSLPFAVAISVTRHAGASDGWRRREDEIEAERIERAVRRSQGRPRKG